MSVYLDRADQMATLIEGLFDDGQVAVVVDRQKDITAEFNKRIGKVKGGVAVAGMRAVFRERAIKDQKAALGQGFPGPIDDAFGHAEGRDMDDIEAEDQP